MNNKELYDKLMATLEQYVGDILLSDQQSDEMKAHVVKKLLGLKPPTNSVQINIFNGDIKTTKTLKIRYERNEYPELNVWRKAVFARDGFKCVQCGSTKKIEAHHVKSWAEYPNQRFDIENGMTLCKKCHSKTDNYGFKNNAVR